MKDVVSKLTKGLFVSTEVNEKSTFQRRDIKGIGRGRRRERRSRRSRRIGRRGRVFSTTKRIPGKKKRVKKRESRASELKRVIRNGAKEETEFIDNDGASKRIKSDKIKKSIFCSDSNFFVHMESVPTNHPL